MSQKIIHIEGVGDVSFYKRKDTRNIRIRISGSDVRVSLPLWVPYKAAKIYVEQKSSWINQHKKSRVFLNNGSQVGKQHTLHIKRSVAGRYSGKISASRIFVTIPMDAEIDSEETQKKFEKYVLKALQIEAEELVMPRVRELASLHDFDVNAIEVKNLKSRWGSCDSKHNLAFSLFLIQLPWECIDYVIYHELSHTRFMNHGKDFWNLVSMFSPNYKLIKLKMKQYSPHIIVQ